MHHTRRNLLGMALMGALAPVWARARRPHAIDRVRLDAALAAIAADPACTLASLSALAMRHGKVVYGFQAGRRHIDGGGGPAVTAATMFRIASISKMVTTLGVLRLVEHGQLALDDDVSAALGFPLRNPHFPAVPVTLRTLLSHTSSLRDAAGYSWSAEHALRDILVPGAPEYGAGAMWAADHAPGAYFTYCNLAFGVVGTLMERVTGERFDRLMRRLILDPLAMRGGYNPAEFSATELSNLATLYRKRTVDTEKWDSAGPWIAQADDYTVHRPQPPAGLDHYVPGTNATPFSPTGGLRVSAPDLAKVMQLLIQRGRANGQHLLQPATLARMQARQWTYDGHNGDTAGGLFRAWGLGNQQFQDAPDTGLVEGGGFAARGHLGDAYGLYSAFVVDVARGNGMIVLTGGTTTDPEQYQGRYSGLTRFEERLLTTLYRGAIAGA